MAGLDRLLADPTRHGNIRAIDGRELSLVHNHVWPEQIEFEAVDRGACPRIILSVGSDPSYEVVSKEDWIGRRPRRDRSRESPIICGGAAVGGFGAIGMTSRGNMKGPACARTRRAECRPHKQRQRSHVEELMGYFGMNGRHGRGARRTRPNSSFADGPRAASATTTERHRAPGPRC